MMNNFSTRLKALRQKNLLTQTELAQQIKELGSNITSKSAISQYENNKRIPDTKVLTTIAKYFDVSVDYLLGIDSNK